MYRSVFDTSIECEAIMTPYYTQMVGNLCHTVVYGLLCALLSAFDEATLGDANGLYKLTSQLLKRPFLADDFWQTIETENLRSLLTSACLSFPLDAKHLLTLCDSLASASADSCRQVSIRTMNDVI